LRFGQRGTLKNKKGAIDLLPTCRTRLRRHTSRRKLQDRFDKLGAQLRSTRDRLFAADRSEGEARELDRSADPASLKSVREPHSSTAQKKLDLLKTESTDRNSTSGSNEPRRWKSRTFGGASNPYPKDPPALHADH